MYDVTMGSQTELTAFYQKVHEYVCSSQFQRELRALMNCTTISEGQGHAAYIILSAIRCSFYSARYQHLRMRPQLCRWRRKCPPQAVALFGMLGRIASPR